MRRLLIASGVTAAMVAVPGTASAEVTSAEAGLQELTSSLQQLAGLASQGETPGADLLEGETPELPELPAFEIPEAFLDGFKTLTGPLGIPESCVDGIAEAIELIINGLLDPAQLTAVIEQLTALLTDFQGTLEDLLDQILGGFPALPGTDPAPEFAALADEAEDVGDVTETPTETPGAGVVAGIELLITTLTTDCVPAPPELPGGETPTPTPPSETPTQQPPAAAPHTTSPAAAPVAYLGYAPTGAGAPSAADTTVPLTALAGGLVLLTGAGAAGYGMRRRAVRTRD